MRELFIDDRADFGLEIYLVKLRLGVRAWLLLIFLIIMKKFLKIFFNGFLRLELRWFFIYKISKGDKDAICHAEDVERMKLLSLKMYPFSKAWRLDG